MLRVSNGTLFLRVTDLSADIVANQSQTAQPIWIMSNPGSMAGKLIARIWLLLAEDVINKKVIGQPSNPIRSNEKKQINIEG